MWGRLKSTIFDQYLTISQKRCKIGHRMHVYTVAYCIYWCFYHCIMYLSIQLQSCQSVSINLLTYLLTTYSLL